jgi:glutaredoxin
MKKIIIYTNETCPYCKQIKEELTKNNMTFENRLTSEFKNEWQKVTNLTGISTVPTILYKENYFVPARDFGNPQHLMSIIKDFKPSEFSPDIQALERIKTLAYGIQTAFGRTDQILRQIETKLNTEEKDEHKSND